MSELVGICGPSGSGKSTSVGNIPELGIKGLNPEETFVINVMGKPLPFRGFDRLNAIERKRQTGRLGNVQKVTLF